MEKKWIIFTIIIVIIIIGVVGILNIAKIQQPYITQECKDVQVPYTDKDCQNVQIPYSNQACQPHEYLHQVILTECAQPSYDEFGQNRQPAVVTCTVNNLENKAGVFTIVYGFTIPDFTKQYSDDMYIYPMGSSSRTYTWDGAIKSCICYVTPPTNQDCQINTQYRAETQCHDITKYRSEKQCQDVTKYRIISIWNSMFG